MVFVQPFNSHDHHVEDGIDFLLVGLLVWTVELEHNRSWRGLAFFHKKAALGHYKVHTGRFHAGKFADCAGKLSLERAGIIYFLDKIGLAHLYLVENLEAYALAHKRAFAGYLDSLVINFFSGNHDGGTIIRQAVLNLFRLQGLDHRAGIFRPKIGVKHLEFGLGQIKGQAYGKSQGGHNATGNGNARRHAQTAPELLDAINSILNVSWHVHPLDPWIWPFGRIFE